jgi:hypothetical protein
MVALGLLVFYGCYQMLRGGQFASASTMTVIGIFVFRGGIHLLKIAVAAQVCLDAKRKADQPHMAAVPKPSPSRAPLRAPTVRVLE